MRKKQFLGAAAAPLAIASMIAAPAGAAESRKRIPNPSTIPEIKPQGPVTVDNTGRVPTTVVSREAADNIISAVGPGEQPDEASGEDEAVPVKRPRIRIPVIGTGGRTANDPAPRLRSRTAATESADPVAVDSAEAAPPTPRSRLPRIRLPGLPVDLGSKPRTAPSRSAPVEASPSGDDGAGAAPRGRIRVPVPATAQDADYGDSGSAAPTGRIDLRKVGGKFLEAIVPSKPRTRPAATPTERKPGRVAIDRRDEAPQRFDGVSRPGSVVLGGSDAKGLPRGLKVLRVIDPSALAKNPRLDVGATTFDFTPFLRNPKSLPNIGQKLRSMPDLVDVHDATVVVSQVPQGVVVTSTLSYSLKPGACTLAENRARILATGVSCFSYRAQSVRQAAVAKPGTVEFVEQSGLRGKALATMRDQDEVVGGDIDKHVRDFRAMLQDPAQRAELEASIGADEVQRMEQLDDTALAGELVNTHDVEIVENGFVPVLQPIKPVSDWDVIQAARTAQAAKLAKADTQLAPATAPTSYAIPEYTFLTGFTLSDRPEWRKRVTTTIKWCLLGCKKSYFAEAWAGFNYGLGMRFPMRFGGTYRFDPNGTATLQPSLNLIDGNVGDYRSAGLPDGQLFNGQELVAQFGADAGVVAKLPLVGGIGPSGWSSELVLTDYLTGSLKGGQLTPPQPGQANLPSGNFVVEQVDLLQNSASFGFIAAKVHPSVNIALSSSDVGVTIQGKPQSFKGGVGQTVALPIDAAQISTFSVSTPSYDVKIQLKPGLTARMTINLAVWTATVDWPVDLPIAGLNIAADFGCHAGTICDRDYVLSPDGPYSPFRRDVKNWGLAYDKKWLPKCLDAICTTSIKLMRYDTVEWAWAQDGGTGQGTTFLSAPSIGKPPVSTRLAQAEAAAEKYYAESVARKAQKSADTSDAMGTLALGIYTPQCQDSACIDAIAALAAQMGPAARDAANHNPNLDPAAINKLVNKEFGPKFVAEIEASKQRAQMAQARSVTDQATKRTKQPRLTN